MASNLTVLQKYLSSYNVRPMDRFSELVGGRGGVIFMRENWKFG